MIAGALAVAVALAVVVGMVALVVRTARHEAGLLRVSWGGNLSPGHGHGRRRRQQSRAQLRIVVADELLTAQPAVSER
jgi:hypothetical protein